MVGRVGVHLPPVNLSGGPSEERNRARSILAGHPKPAWSSSKLDMQNGSLGGQRLDRCKDGRDYEQPSRGKGDGEPGLWF